MQLSLFSTSETTDLKEGFSLEAIFEAYFYCRSNKRNTINALAFELDYESNLIQLWKELNDGSYQPGKSIAFIDTGASDLVIDRNFERELLIIGAIDKNSYLGKSKYVLANNEEISADIIKVNNLKIGDFILNNVVIAVVEEGGMLCGKSLLDKFRNWEFNKLNNSLILFK